MIFILICLALIVIIAICDFFTGGWEEGFATLFFGGAGAIVLGLIISFIVGCSVSYPNTADTATSQLADLHDTTYIQGSFVLGTGYINSVYTYSYYKTVGLNQYQHSTLEDQGNFPIIVVEDTQKNPY